MLRNIIIKNRYLDSVMLMSIAAKAKSGEGVKEVSAMMGTDANKDILANSKLLDDSGRKAAPMDLIIAIEAADESAIEKAAAEVEKLLSQRQESTGPEEEAPPHSLSGAVERLPKADLLFISLPGPYVRREAEAALNQGLNVMIFSDNVTPDDEIALKEKARSLGLLVMGPDCGTAIIGGVALGFANVVTRGEIGIVGASGTGTQEVSCIISNVGQGISQAIGTGGRDLKEEIGGISMIQGLEALSADPDTEVIVLVSKPPAPAVARKILDIAKDCGKPVVVNFLKGESSEAEKRGLPFARTLEQGALMAVATLEGKKYKPTGITAELRDSAKKAGSKLTTKQRYIRGLFSGGTLTDETLLVLQELIGDCYSNTPLKDEYKLKDPNKSVGHCLVDLGDDEFTRGRPHPMIDFELRCERIVQEAGDPETAVILLDVVLGYGSNPDPAGELVPAIREAQRIAKDKKRAIIFVASVTGTDADPQNRSQQVSALEAAGVHVLSTNAEASRFAGLVVSTRGK